MDTVTASPPTTTQRRLPRADHSLVSLGQLLHLVGLGLSGPLYDSDELLVSALDLLLLDGDLLLPLHHLDLDLFKTDLLLLLGCLQLVRQLSFCFLGRQILQF